MSSSSRTSLPLVVKLVFAVVPLLLLLVGAELGARMFWEPGNSQGLTGQDMAPHPTRIWGLNLGEQSAYGIDFHVGDNGLRTVKTSGAPLRALTLGDSSIFGHGVPDGDTLHDHIRTEFERRGFQVDVYDGGIPGYSSQQSLQLLEDAGWDLKPDLLIIGNLWSDNGVKGFTDRKWMAELDKPTFRVEWVLKQSKLWWWLRWQLDPPESAALPVVWLRDPEMTGERRVTPTQYAENLDTMMIEAARRDVGVIMLRPCNSFLAQGGAIEGTQWEPYFIAMQKLSWRRGVSMVEGCRVLRDRGLSRDEAYVDFMHPSAALNQGYGEVIVETALGRGWPEKRLVPNPEPPMWTEEIPDTFDTSVMIGQVERFQSGTAKPSP